MKEQTIIQKAMEGWWKPDCERKIYCNCSDNGDHTHSIWSYLEEPNKDSSFFVSHKETVLDPLFWQALGKACGWNKWHDHEWDNDGIVGFSEEKYHALSFHEINLTEGWDKAIDYLYNLIQK